MSRLNRISKLQAPSQRWISGAEYETFSRLPVLLTILLLGVLLISPLLAEDGRVAQSAGDVHPLLVGMKIPDVTYQKADGGDVSLKDLSAQKPIVLIYYRGGW